MWHGKGGSKYEVYQGNEGIWVVHVLTFCQKPFTYHVSSKHVYTVLHIYIYLNFYLYTHIIYIYIDEMEKNLFLRSQGTQSWFGCHGSRGAIASCLTSHGGCFMATGLLRTLHHTFGMSESHFSSIFEMMYIYIFVYVWYIFDIVHLHICLYIYLHFLYTYTLYVYLYIYTCSIFGTTICI